MIKIIKVYVFWFLSSCHTMTYNSFERNNMIILYCLSMSTISLIILFSITVLIYSTLKFLIRLCWSSISTLLGVTHEESEYQVEVRVCVLHIRVHVLARCSLCQQKFSMEISLHVASDPDISYSFIAYLFVTKSPRWLLMQGWVK